MKRLLATMLSLYSSSALADCGQERLNYMSQDDPSSAKALIACLETELAHAQQVTAASGGSAGGNCPTVPIIPVSPRSPGNPVGSEEQIYAFMTYYRSLSELDAARWMIGAASALGQDDAAALVVGRSSLEFCSDGLTTYDFDWDAGQYFDAENDFGILIFPEIKGAFGGQ